MFDDYDTIKTEYEDLLKTVAIKSKIQTSESYLMIGFACCEMVLAKVGFDMEGYSAYQAQCMDKYKTLLEELGEKSYVPPTVSRWPVEIRLIGLILFQTTMFVVSKVVFKKTNLDILSILAVNTAKAKKEDSPKTQSVDRRSSGFESTTDLDFKFISKSTTEKGDDRPSSSNASDKSRMKGPTTTPPINKMK